MSTICVFGDSVSKGVVFDSVKRKYMLLKNCFANAVGAAGLTVTNYSKFGCNILRGREILQKHLNDVSAFDYTVMEFGGNDCDFNWADVAAAPQNEHLPQTTVEEFELVYGEMVGSVRGHGGTPVLLSLPPIDASKYFAWVTHGLEAQNILNWLGDVEHIARWHEMYNLAVYRVGLHWKTPVIDISSVFLSTGRFSEMICEDGIHPSEEGHRAITAAIADYAEKHIPSVPKLALA